MDPSERDLRDTPLITILDRNEAAIRAADDRCNAVHHEEIVPSVTLATHPLLDGPSNSFVNVTRATVVAYEALARAPTENQLARFSITHFTTTVTPLTSVTEGRQSPYSLWASWLRSRISAWTSTPILFLNPSSASNGPLQPHTLSISLRPNHLRGR